MSFFFFLFFFTLTVCRFQLHMYCYQLKCFPLWNKKYTSVLPFPPHPPLSFFYTFLEMLSSILTFSSCKRGITCRSQGSHWPLWPQCHLGSVENNNPRRSFCAGFCLCQQVHVHSSTLGPFSQVLGGLMDNWLPQLTSPEPCVGSQPANKARHFTYLIHFPEGVWHREPLSCYLGQGCDSP